MTNQRSEAVVVNGWTLFAHPLFLEQLETLINQVEGLRRKDPEGYARKNAAKRLAVIAKLAFEAIPQDPSRVEYRQGSTLGEKHKHWFRAKFFGQYRLFFRYHQENRIIVYAWVNDEESKRAYGSPDDAYRVFRTMLQQGHPPDNWVRLLEEAQEQRERFERLKDAL